MHMLLLQYLVSAARDPAKFVLPLVARRARAGFPSPADDYVEDGLDLNQLMVQHKAATFFVRVRGYSMEQAGIRDGDLLVVDRALKPRSGQIVVAAIDGELVVKRLVRRRGQVILEAASPDYGPIEIHDGQTLDIWGVVTGVVRRMV